MVNTMSSPTQILLLALSGFLVISLFLEFSGNREIIPILFAISLIVLYFWRGNFVDGLGAISKSRDIKLIALFALFAISSLQIHTFEVLWGFCKVGWGTAYHAGFRFGHALAGLV